MKKAFTTSLYTLTLGSLLSGCQAVGEVIGAGVHVGIFLVAMTTGIALFVITSAPVKNSYKRSLWARKRMKKVQ